MVSLCLQLAVSGGCLSFRAPGTWLFCVAAGAAAWNFLCLSSSDSLYPALQALIVAVSQAKYALGASWPELGPGRYIIIKGQRKTPCFCMAFFFGIRRLPIFPGRLQPSIVGV